MRNRLMSVLSVVAVLSFAASILCASAVPTAKGPDERLLLFNFAPASSRDIEGFVKVSASSAYDKNQGYGWTDLKGKVATGAFGEPFLAWEGCDNLNLITRPSPDEIGRTYAAGPATFAVDLPNGKYEVWMLVGDTGFLDYLPHENFSILAGKETVFKRDYKPAECYAAYDFVPPDDTITEYQAYKRYVAPRFEWKKADVFVTDGQLKLTMNSPERTPDSMKFSPAQNELTLGPAKRFAGSLCALMVTTAPPKEDISLGRIEMLEALRRENFRRHFPRVYPPDSAEPKLEKADTRRGYTLFFPDPSEDVAPNTFRPHVEKPIALRACPGEAVPITFALYAVNDLSHVDVSAGYLRSKVDNIPPKSFDITQVRFCAQPGEKLPDGGFKWKPVPLQLVPVNDAPLPKGATRQFWLTLTVPEKAKPGAYTGKLSLTPTGGQSMSIDLTLEVLPFALKHPTDVTVGVTYAIPASEASFDEKRLWERVRADLGVIRRYGFTPVDCDPALAAVCKELALARQEGLRTCPPHADRVTTGLLTYSLFQEKAPVTLLTPFNGYAGLPSDFFDAGAQPPCLAFPGEKFSIIPTLSLERVRQGINDLAYLNTLKQLADAAPAGPAKDAAQKLLADVKTNPRSKDLDETRDQLIDACLKLLPPPPAPPKKK